jgi:hypothetical protein
MGKHWRADWAYAYCATGGEVVGPVGADLASVHSAARECIRLSGGSAAVLRAAEGGWREVARYTSSSSEADERALTTEDLNH